MYASTEITQSVPEPSGGSPSAAHSVRAQQLGDGTMLVLSVLVALLTAAAMEDLEATTLDFLAETSMSMASSST